MAKTSHAKNSPEYESPNFYDSKNVPSLPDKFFSLLRSQPFQEISLW